MPQARHTTRMLLSLAFLIAGCGGGGGGKLRRSHRRHRRTAAHHRRHHRRRHRDRPVDWTRGPATRPASRPSAPRAASPSARSGCFRTSRSVTRLLVFTQNPTLDAAGAGRCEPLVRGWSGSASCACSTTTRPWQPLGLPRHRRARRVFVRRMRPARDGVSSRFPRDAARVSDVHQHCSARAADRILISRNSPRPTAGSR